MVNHYQTMVDRYVEERMKVSVKPCGDVSRSRHHCGGNGLRFGDDNDFDSIGLWQYRRDRQCRRERGEKK